MSCTMILVGEEQWFSSSWGRIAGFSKFSFFVASLCCYSRNVRLDGVKTGWGRTSFGTKTPSPFSSLIYSRHALSTSTITFSFLFFFSLVDPPRRKKEQWWFGFHRKCGSGVKCYRLLNKWKFIDSIPSPRMTILIRRNSHLIM